VEESKEVEHPLKRGRTFFDFIMSILTMPSSNTTDKNINLFEKIMNEGKAIS
jgi:hypothetical protein